MQSIANSFWRLLDANILILGTRDDLAVAMFFLCNGAGSVTLVADDIKDWDDSDGPLYQTMLVCTADPIDPLPIVTALNNKSHKGLLQTIESTMSDLKSIAHNQYNFVFSTAEFVMDSDLIPQLVQITKLGGEHHHYASNGNDEIPLSDNLFRSAGMAPQAGIFSENQKSGLHLVRPDNEYTEWLDEKTADMTSVSHVKTRYSSILPFITDKSVIDIGCGSGIGSRMMIKAGAKDLTGIDYSTAGIKYARSSTQNKQAAFTYHDLETPLPYADGSFDVAVCFEVLEHIVNQQQLVSEIFRVLKDDGIFVISVPSQSLEDWTSRIDGYENRFHLHVPTFEELKALLDVFPFVQWYGQHDIVMSGIYPMSNKMTLKDSVHIGETLQATDTYANAHIAVCGKFEKPPCLDTTNHFAHSSFARILNSYKEEAANHKLEFQMTKYANWQERTKNRLWGIDQLLGEDVPVHTAATLALNLPSKSVAAKLETFLQATSGIDLDVISRLIENMKCTGGVEKWASLLDNSTNISPAVVMDMVERLQHSSLHFADSEDLLGCIETIGRSQDKPICERGLFFEALSTLIDLHQNDTTRQGVLNLLDFLKNNETLTEKWQTIVEPISKSGRVLDWVIIVEALSKMDMDALLAMTEGDVDSLAVILRCVGLGLDHQELRAIAEKTPPDPRQQKFFKLANNALDIFCDKEGENSFRKFADVMDVARGDLEVWHGITEEVKRTGRAGDWEKIIKAIAGMDMDALLRLIEGDMDHLAVILRCVGLGLDPYTLSDFAESTPLDKQNIIKQGVEHLSTALCEGDSNDNEAVLELIKIMRNNPQFWHQIVLSILDESPSSVVKVYRLLQLIKAQKNNA
ncbi:class I SAM-dependent methyltransferase [Maridesulfovibrio sp.]|uniref:class I SAM-dependent methyltransferase n=1 Tax=Maridesulfovibrio sp. TaxID=2795000 RepID=UPI003BA939FA